MSDVDVDISSSTGSPTCEACTLARTASSRAVDRLTFLKQGAAAIAAVALAACGGDSPTAPSALSATTVSLTSNPSLANVGGVATLSIDGTPVAVVRESTNVFAAFSLICPHQGNTVQPQGSRFYCPGHGATFDLAGNWTGGQHTGNLRAYPTTYDAAGGTVTIGG